MQIKRFISVFLMMLPFSLQAETSALENTQVKTSLAVTADKEKVFGTFSAYGDGKSINETLNAPANQAEVVHFSSTETVPGQFELKVEVHGKTLTASVDKDNKSAKLAAVDGKGAEVFLNAKDRSQLDALFKAYEQQGYGGQSDAGNMLKRLLSLWAQTPDSVSLQRSVDGVSTSAYQNLCSYKGMELAASHDGNQCGYDDPECTSLALLGSRGSNTESFINGQWTTAVPDHIPYVRQRGECYGNCGGGCPSGNQILTRDCLNHDQCVRNGHSLASAWCNDDFTYTFDDAMFAPECPGTD